MWGRGEDSEGENSNGTDYRYSNQFKSLEISTNNHFKSVQIKLVPCSYYSLSLIKNCPHILRFDLRELRNSQAKLGWVGGGGWSYYIWSEGVSYLRTVDSRGDPVSSSPPGHGGGRSGAHRLTPHLVRLPGRQGLRDSQEAERGGADWNYRDLTREKRRKFFFSFLGELCQYNLKITFKWIWVLD